MDARRSERLCHLFFHAVLVGLVAIGFLLPRNILADGSKDLISNGGNRPFLEGGSGRTTAGIDRQNQIFLFARAGEIIHLGSSAFGLYKGDIRYTSPDGKQGSCSAIKPDDATRQWGRIQSITEELAGPAPSRGGYTPCTLAVDTEGIWQISFIGPDPDSWKFSASLPAQAAWTQQADVYTIAAWDATVRSSSGEDQTGRVYANHLPLNLGSEEATLAAQVFALTRDGYVYRIDLNGMRAHTLVVFANNSGFRHVASGTVLYRSVVLDEANTANKGLPDGVDFQNPLAPDSENDRTYKLFFTLPDTALPITAGSALGSQWLRMQRMLPPKPAGLTFSGTMGNGGGFAFTAQAAARYQLVIDLNKNGQWGDATDVVLYGTARQGSNTITWNGLDAEGNKVYGVKDGFQARLIYIAGEIHVPQFDVEHNGNGVVIERLNAEKGNAFTVYYDDRMLADRSGAPDPVNGQAGIDSRLGARAFVDRFGDHAGIDSWAFEASEPVYLSEPIYILRNDLRLSVEAESITPDPGGITTLTLHMANDGPHHAGAVGVRLQLPPGLQLLSSEPTDGVYDEQNRVWNVSELNVATTAMLPITVSADEKGVYQVFAEIIEQAGDDIDSTPDNFNPLLPEITLEDDTAEIELYVDAEPAIGIAKRVTHLEGDPSGFTATIEMVVANLGNTPLTEVQVTDPLPSILQGTDYQITNFDAVAPLVRHAGFNGKSEVNLLNAGESNLEVGEEATLTYTVQVTPVGSLGPFSGNAEVHASGPQAVQISDVSDDGAVPDADRNGFAGDAGENDPTGLAVDENPMIGIALQIADVQGSESAFSAAYRIVVENLGNTPLNSVQVTNNLLSAFGPGQYTVSDLQAQAPLRINTGYDGGDDKALLDAGQSTLGVGQKATITFELAVTSQAPGTRFNQLAQATAVSPFGAEVSDASDDGTDPDPNGNGRADDAGESDVTVLTFEGRPVVGAALVTSRVTGDLSGFTAYYDLRISNLGDTPLTSIQAVQDLAEVFKGTEFSVSELKATQGLLVNSSFDGRTDKNLLAGQNFPLVANETAHVTFAVTVTPVTYFGPYSNSVVVNAQNAMGIPANDLSDSGTEVDADGDGQPNEPGENDPIVTAFAPDARLGTALGIDQVAGNLGAFTATYTIVVENMGDVPMDDLSLTQHLDSTFAGSRYEVVEIQAEAPLALNERFDGKRYTELLDAHAAPLGVGEKAAVTVVVQVTPFDGFGPYYLGAVAAGTSTSGIRISDVSVEGLNPDPNGNGRPDDPEENRPSILSVDERPVIGVSMSAVGTSGNLTQLTSRYVIRLQNLGDVPLHDVQVDYDLETVMDGTDFEVLQLQATGDVKINGLFDGIDASQVLDAAASKLAVGDTARIEIDVRIRPESNLGPYASQVLASASGPNGALTSDVSGDGFLIDVNGNGISNENEENTPTVIAWQAKPGLGVTRTLTLLEEDEDGHNVAFEISIFNLGDVPLSQIQVVEDFASAFPGAEIYVESPTSNEGASVVLNPDFNGIADPQLLLSDASTLAPGQKASLSLKMHLVAGQVTQFVTRSYATAVDPAGQEVEDWSNDGPDPDPNGNGIAAEPAEDVPTRIDLEAEAALHVASSIDKIVGDSTQFNVAFSVDVHNSGTKGLYSVQVLADLASLFPGAQVEVVAVEMASGAGFQLNPDFDGTGNPSLLNEQASRLASGQLARIRYEVQVTPGDDFGPFRGALEATALASVNERIDASVHTLPIKLKTSSGQNAGLESNGNLAGLVAERAYRQQNTPVLAAKGAASMWLRQAGVSGAQGVGGYTNQALLDLIPLSGPEGTDATVTTPLDLFGVTNATSVLAVDYVRQDQRLAALFTTTTPAGETYEHSKNICDRLQGGALLGIELISIRGYPFVLSVIEQATGEVDYAISFVGYQRGASYLIDSRFVGDQYRPPFDAGGEILNFQIWSFNPAYAVQLVEQVVKQMEAQGSIGFVSQENDIPAVPEGFIQQGSYRQGTLVFEVHNAAGANTFTLKGETTDVEGGEKSVFEKVVPVPADQKNKPVVTLTVPSDPIYDVLLEITNDANADLDQVYLADGSWGRLVDGEASSVEAFTVLKQEKYDAGADRLVIERGVYFKGVIADDALLFRQLRPAARAVDLSAYSHLSFKASGSGTMRVQLEQANDRGEHFAKEIELDPSGKFYTISFDELSKQVDAGRFQGTSTTALSFAFSGSISDPQQIELRVSDIVFSKDAVSIPVEDDGLIPTVYSLAQNYPNPFHPSTTIGFGLPEPSAVKLVVYDLLGREVMTVAQADYPAGMHKVQLDASRLASGLYIYRLVANENVFTKTMHVVR